MPNLASHVIPSTGGYEIDQSLRFNDDDSAYLTRTPASAGNRKTWTWSGWVKRGRIGGTDQGFFEGNLNFDGSNYFSGIRFEAEKIIAQDIASGSYNLVWRTSAVYRDSGSWYHVVVSYDTTQASSSNTVNIYINGVQQEVSFTAYSGAYVQNRDSYINATNTHSIGTVDAANHFDGYLADVHFIDGQALDASYFGETDADYGHWKPIKYTGTYGTNGFYLDFSNSSSLGEDQSGNSNDWTSNNLAATDVVLDSPTNNFATLNPLDKKGASALAEGNLKTPDLSANYPIRSTAAISSGLWYWEVLVVSGTVTNHHGIWAVNTEMGLTYVGATSNSWGIYDANGNKRNNASFVSYGSAFANGDVLMTALDMDSGKIWWGKNGTWFASGDPAAGTNAAFTNVSGTVSPAELQYDAAVVNFGQDSSFAGNKTAQGNTDANGIGDFYYAPPSGYLALCTQNLPEPTVAPADHFNTVLYTGNGTTGHAITGVGFQPDWVWAKGRSVAYSHGLYDSVRGAGQKLSSNLTNAEVTAGLTAFNSDGFTLDSDAGLNQSSATYVGWNWKANGSGVTNTDGTITSTVSANVDAGFSIVSYTGNGTDNATVGHGLSQAPDLIINKNRDTAAQWVVVSSVLGYTNRLHLNGTDALSAQSAFYKSASATTFTVGTSGNTNGSGNDIITYCFHSVDSFSKVGSYTGNGSNDGPFVYTGFRPAYLMIKYSSGTGNWVVQNNKTGPYNVNATRLEASTSNAENTSTASGGYGVDFLSNGFKLRNTNTNWNASGGTYIFLAFAETPFKFSNGR